MLYLYLVGVVIPVPGRCYVIPVSVRYYVTLVSGRYYVIPVSGKCYVIPVSGGCYFLPPAAVCLLGLSVLDLCLVISMKQLTDAYCGGGGGGAEAFTFQMVYDHYLKFSQSRSSTKPYCKAIAMKSFEHLIHLQLVVPVTDGSQSVPKEFWPMSLHVSAQEVDEAVFHYAGCPSDVKQWASNNWHH